MENAHEYEDMLHLSHHTSPRRVSMSRMDRAAQFSAFAALTGYDATIEEVARITDQAAILDESRVESLNGQLQRLKEAVEPQVTVIYFRPDVRKAGGAYVRITGVVKKVDAVTQNLLLTDGQIIPFHQIYSIESTV